MYIKKIDHTLTSLGYHESLWLTIRKMSVIDFNKQALLDTSNSGKKIRSNNDKKA